MEVEFRSDFARSLAEQNKNKTQITSTAVNKSSDLTEKIYEDKTFSSLCQPKLDLMTSKDSNNNGFEYESSGHDNSFSRLPWNLREQSNTRCEAQLHALRTQLQQSELRRRALATRLATMCPNIFSIPKTSIFPLISTHDESGFSSLNSLHEVGVPTIDEEVDMSSGDLAEALPVFWV